LTKPGKYGTVNPMPRRIFILLIVFLIWTQGAYAFWVWTPETGKWINPKWDVKDTPQEQLEFALESYKAKDYEKANNEFQKLIKHYPKAREAAEAQYYIGQSLEDQGQFYKAFKAYQMVIEKYPFSERSPQIVEKQYQIGEKLLEGQGKRSKFVTVVIGSEYDVVDVFRTVIKNAPYGKLAAPSQYKIGLYLQEKGMFQESRDEFEKVINDYPDSEWVKAAKYQIALVDSQRSTPAEYDQNVTKSAVEEFKEFVTLYPDAELSDKAKEHINVLKEKEAENNFLIARFYEKQKNYKAARVYYDTIIKEYAFSPLATKAVEKLRELDLKEKKTP